MERPHRFLTLDALRGLGALAVMHAHTARFFGLGTPASSPLAVDFFAMLSGFVLSFAYQHRLDQQGGQGWSTRTFLQVRLIRIYPVYLLGVLSGFFFLFLQSRYGHDHLPIPTLLSFLALGLVLLPVPSGLAGGGTGMFPCDVPAWSLFFEFLANLLHGLLLRRRGWRFLVALAVLWAVILQVGILTRQSLNIGAYRSDLVFGFARILYGYTLGLLLFRLWNARSHSIPTVSPIFPLLLFAGFLASRLSTTLAPRFGLLGITLIIPAILLLGAKSPMPRALIRPAQILGAISYSLYLIHVPIAELFEQFWKHLFHHPIEADAPWPGVLCFLLTSVLALAVNRLYDQPIRAAINRRLIRPQPRTQPEPQSLSYVRLNPAP